MHHSQKPIMAASLSQAGKWLCFASIYTLAAAWPLISYQWAKSEASAPTELPTIARHGSDLIYVVVFLGLPVLFAFNGPRAIRLARATGDSEPSSNSSIAST